MHCITIIVLLYLESKVEIINDCMILYVCTLFGRGCIDCSQLLPRISNALIDIDECQEDLASCNPLNSLCSNTNGSYLCPCLEGFSPSNGICEGEVDMHLLRYCNLRQTNGAIFTCTK